MSINAYDRNDPNGPDFSHFGDGWLEANSALLPFICPSWVTRSGETPFWFREAITHKPDDVVPLSPRFLEPCLASFRSGIVEPGPVTCVYPDSTLILERDSKQFLLEETLWHSELFYDGNFRCDRSTGWRWRYRKAEIDLTICAPTVVVFNKLSHIYFHWFFDVISRVWISQKKIKDRSFRYFVGPVDKRFQKETLPILGIGPDEILDLPKVNNIIHFERGAVPVSLFKEPLKTRFSRDHGTHYKGWSPEFISEFRELSLKHFNIGFTDPDLKLYVDRGDASYRKVLNNSEIIEHCLESGFQVVTPGELSLKEQIDLFSRAKVVVGCHGAGLTNIMWMRPGGILVEFMPACYDDASFRFLSGLVGLEYHCLFAQTEEQQLDCFWADCRVEKACLVSILNRL